MKKLIKSVRAIIRSVRAKLRSVFLKPAATLLNNNEDEPSTGHSSLVSRTTPKGEAINLCKGSPDEEKPEPENTKRDPKISLDPLGRLQNKNGLSIPVDLSGPYKEKERQLYEQLKERELLQYIFPAFVRMYDFNEDRSVATLKAEMENGLSLTQLPAPIPSMDFVPPFRIPTHFPALHCSEPSATLPYATGYDGQFNLHSIYYRYWMDHNAKHAV